MTGPVTLGRLHAKQGGQGLASFHQVGEMIAGVMDHASPDFVGAFVYTSAAAARFMNGLPGAIGYGFVDVLRLGDGVKAGGWGYGQDALRVLAVAGPALKVGRFGLALVAAVDETTLANCTWVAGSRALRMSGTRHFARVGDLARAFGITLPDTGRLWPRDLVPGLAALGADARVARAWGGVTVGASAWERRRAA